MRVESAAPSSVSGAFGHAARAGVASIPSGSSNLCIDPVPPDEGDLAEIVRMGVSKILLTNRNHSRAANVVRARTNAKTLIHADDAAHARSQGAEIDGELNGGEPIGTDF